MVNFGMVHGAEILPDFDAIQWIFARRDQLLGLLAIGKREEVCLCVEAAIWYGLVGLLAGFIICEARIVNVADANGVAGLA